MVKGSSVLVAAAASGLVGAQANTQRRRGSASSEYLFSRPMLCEKLIRCDSPVVPSRTTAAVPSITTMANAKRQLALPTDINPYTFIPTNLPFSVNGTQLASDLASFATGTASTYTTSICTSKRVIGEQCVPFGCSKTPQAFTVGAIETSIPVPACGLRLGSQPSGSQASPTGTAQPSANAGPARALPLNGLRLPGLLRRSRDAGRR